MSTPASPPAKRSYLWQQVNEAANENRLKLQVCEHCEEVQYPPQEFCYHCLSNALNWETLDNTGTVLSWTKLDASSNDFFKSKLPMYVAYIRLDAGPVIFAHLTAESAKTETVVQVLNRIDKSGQAAFFAVSVEDDSIEKFKDIIKE